MMTLQGNIIALYLALGGKFEDSKMQSAVPFFIFHNGKTNILHIYLSVQCMLWTSCPILSLIQSLLGSRRELYFWHTVASLHLLREVVLVCSSLCSGVDQDSMVLSYLMRYWAFFSFGILSKVCCFGSPTLQRFFLFHQGVLHGSIYSSAFHC